MPDARPARGRASAAPSAAPQLLGQRPPAGRLEPGGGVVRHACDVARSAARSRRRRWRRGGWRRAAWADGSSSSAVTTLAPCWRSCRPTWRASVPRPPNWPTTTRSSASEAPTALSCSSSRIAATPGPVPVRAALTSRARTVAGPHTPSTSRPQLRWKSSSARAVAGPKMPSMRPQSKPEAASDACSAATSSPRRCGATRRSGRSPRRHDASTSASHVGSSHAPVVVQAAVALEGLHGGLGDGAERTRLGTDRGEPGDTQAALQVADGVAVLTAGQREETRNSSSSWSSWDLPLAPTRRLCTSPPLKTSSVGMLMTL